MLESELVPLAGGEGRSFRSGEVVLKPVADEIEATWVAELLSRLPERGFRVERPIRSAAGHWIVHGWTAWKCVAGDHLSGRWAEIIKVGEAFHAALRGVQKPSFIGRRTNPWSIGDRVAWGELPIEDFAAAKHLHRLVRALRPMGQPSQLIHGDLTGNVLFADGLAPAIIDFSPYWRPTGFAAAIVVADALVSEGADESLLEAVSHVADFDQLLLRALIYRIIADRHFQAGKPPRPDEEDPYLPVVDLACRLTAA